MIQKILKWWILGTIFLLPLFWLPFSFEWIEFSKLYLLFFLSWGGVFLWNLKMIIIDKGIRIRWSKFDWLVLLFFLTGIVSFAFSSDMTMSLFGTYGRFNNGLLALLSFFAFYLLIRNNVGFEKRVEKKEEKETGEGIKVKIVQTSKSEGVISLNQVFWALFLSSFFVILWVWVWLLFGKALVTFLKIPLIFSPVANSALGTSVFLALMIVLVLAKTLLEKKNLLKQIFFWIFLVLAICLVLIFDFSSAWIILGASLICFIFFSLKEKIFRENIHKLILPIFLILLSGLFLLLNFRTLVSGLGLERTLILNYPTENILWQSESWQIGEKTVLSSIKTGILGSGIGTFILDFAKFRSDRILKSPFWGIRFVSSGNNASEILATFGGFGFLVFLVMIGVILFYLLKLRKETSKKLIFGTLLIGAVVAQFVFYQNMALGWFFWLMMGIGTGILFEKEKSYSFKESPEIGLIFETVTLILIIALIGGGFFGIKFYLADYNYKNALAEVNLDKKIEALKKAVNLNPYQTNYQMALAQSLVQKLQREIVKPQKEQNQNLIQNTAGTLGFYLQRQNKENQKNVLVLQGLANIYRDLIGIVQGKPEDEAIEKYTKAIELESKNPILYTERGKIYLQKGLQDKAKEDFQRAIDLVPFYLDAQIQMTFIEENEGKREEAIKRLENLANLPPLNSNTDLLFRLGWLYYNNKEYDKAISVLEKVNQFNPFHVNALFILALAYEKKGNKEKAIDLLERLIQLNPDNQTVKDKLKELKGEEIKEEVSKEPQEK